MPKELIKWQTQCLKKGINKMGATYKFETTKRVIKNPEKPWKAKMPMQMIFLDSQNQAFKYNSATKEWVYLYRFRVKEV